MSLSMAPAAGLAVELLTTHFDLLGLVARWFREEGQAGVASGSWRCVRDTRIGDRYFGGALMRVVISGEALA